MLTILGITGPIFILIGLGFAAVRRGILAKAELRALGAFVINFAMPALLFRAMREQAAGQLLDPRLFAIYTVGSLAMAGLAIGYALLIRRQSLQTGSILAMGVSISNSAYIGFPIAQQVLGSQASAMLAIYVSVESMIMLPLLMTLAELGGQRHAAWWQVVAGILGRLARNPMLLGILAGVLFAGLDLPVPLPISRAIDMLASASGPVALFYIGGILAGLSLRSLSADVGSVLLGKLIVHPLLLLGVFLLLPAVDPALQKAAVLNAAMPMMSIYPILGQKYGREEMCTATLVATTAISFFTISSLLWLMGVS